MRRLAFIVAVALASLGPAPPTALAVFNFEEVDSAMITSDGLLSTQAGSHPFVLTTTVRFNTVEDSGLEAPDDNLRYLQVEYPAGLVAMPSAMPQCSTADFLQIEGDENACSDSSAVGIAEVTASASDPIPAGSGDFLDPVPIYNLTPVSGTVARIGFVAAGQPIFVQLGLRDVPPHNALAAVTDFPELTLLYSARMSIWGVPADPVHDPDRGQCIFSIGACPTTAPELAFLTAPRSCAEPLETIFHASSWQEPAQWITAVNVASDGSEPPGPLRLAGCDSVDVLASIDAQPTTDLANTPSGFDLSIDMATDDLANPSGRASSEARKLAIVLPEGVALNPEVTGDAVTCTADQYTEEILEPGPDEGCPQASEVGAIEVESPLLEGAVLGGQVFIAQHGSALYLVVRDPELGILVKQAGEIDTDPFTDQLVITFDQLPQLPFSHLGFHLHDDPGALITPPACGDFTTKVFLSPWSAPDTTYALQAPFEISAGAEGGPCPSGEEQPGEEPPADPDDGDSGTAGLTTVNPAPPEIVLPAPVKLRPCPKGKRRVRAKGPCRRKRCSPRRTDDRRGDRGTRRTLVRPCGRSRDGG